MMIITITMTMHNIRILLLRRIIVLIAWYRFYNRYIILRILKRVPLLTAINR